MNENPNRNPQRTQYDPEGEVRYIQTPVSPEGDVRNEIEVSEATLARARAFITQGVDRLRSRRTEIFIRMIGHDTLFDELYIDMPDDKSPRK